MILWPNLTIAREIHAHSTRYIIRSTHTIGSRDYFEWMYGPEAGMVSEFDHNTYLRYVTAHGIVPFQDLRDQLENAKRTAEVINRVH